MVFAMVPILPVFVQATPPRKELEMPSERSLEKANKICSIWEPCKCMDRLPGTPCVCQKSLVNIIAVALDNQVRKDAKIAYNNNDSCNGLNCNKRFNIEQAILSQLQPKKGEKI